MSRQRLFRALERNNDMKWIRDWIARLLIDRKRDIFYFWDGRGGRRIDPATVYRRLTVDPEFNWETDPVLIDMGNEAESLDASARTVAAVRRAFEIPALDHKRGLTETECLRLLMQFVDSMSALKKNTNTPPTSPESTESAFSDTSTTKPASDSGSTSTEQNSGGCSQC